jgi:hypothetical protein
VDRQMQSDVAVVVLLGLSALLGRQTRKAKAHNVDGLVSRSHVDSEVDG